MGKFVNNILKKYNIKTENLNNLEIIHELEKRIYYLKLKIKLEKENKDNYYESDTKYLKNDILIEIDNYCKEINDYEKSVIILKNFMNKKKSSETVSKKIFLKNNEFKLFLSLKKYNESELSNYNIISLFNIYEYIINKTTITENEKTLSKLSRHFSLTQLSHTNYDTINKLIQNITKKMSLLDKKNDARLILNQNKQMLKNIIKFRYLEEEIYDYRSDILEVLLKDETYEACLIEVINSIPDFKSSQNYNFSLISILISFYLEESKRLIENGATSSKKLLYLKRMIDYIHKQNKSSLEENDLLVIEQLIYSFKEEIKEKDYKKSLADKVNHQVDEIIINNDEKIFNIFQNKINYENKVEKIMGVLSSDKVKYGFRFIQNKNSNILDVYFPNMTDFVETKNEEFLYSQVNNKNVFGLKEKSINNCLVVSFLLTEDNRLLDFSLRTTNAVITEVFNGDMENQVQINDLNKLLNNLFKEVFDSLNLPIKVNYSNKQNEFMALMNELTSCFYKIDKKEAHKMFEIIKNQLLKNNNIYLDLFTDIEDSLNFQNEFISAFEKTNQKVLF